MYLIRRKVLVTVLHLTKFLKAKNEIDLISFETLKYRSADRNNFKSINILSLETVADWMSFRKHWHIFKDSSKIGGVIFSAMMSNWENNIFKEYFPFENI